MLIFIGNVLICQSWSKNFGELSDYETNAKALEYVDGNLFVFYTDNDTTFLADQTNVIKLDMAGNRIWRKT